MNRQMNSWINCTRIDCIAVNKSLRLTIYYKVGLAEEEARFAATATTTILPRDSGRSFSLQSRPS